MKFGYEHVFMENTNCLPAENPDENIIDIKLNKQDVHMWVIVRIGWIKRSYPESYYCLRGICTFWKKQR